MKKRRTFDHIKAGWETIGGKKIYFRSNLELKYAIYLQQLKDTENIKDWEYESETFWFDGIKRGVVSYKPDFKVYENDGSHFFVECKGWMDAKSKTKIKRFRKYFKDEKLVLYPAEMEFKL